MKALLFLTTAALALTACGGDSHSHGTGVVIPHYVPALHVGGSAWAIDCTPPLPPTVGAGGGRTGVTVVSFTATTVTFTYEGGTATRERSCVHPI